MLNDGRENCMPIPSEDVYLSLLSLAIHSIAGKVQYGVSSEGGDVI